MGLHAAGEDLDLPRELRKWHRVALGELADAAGEGLRDAIQLALERCSERSQPLVVDDERLDLLLGQLRVLGVELVVEVLLGLLELGLGVSLLVEERRVALQRPALVVELRVQSRALIPLP